MREYYGVGQPTGVDRHGMQAAYKSLFGDPFNKDAAVGPDGTYIPSLYFGQQVESLMSVSCGQLLVNHECHSQLQRAVS